MINRAALSLFNARNTIFKLLAKSSSVPCTFFHGKYEIKGEIIEIRESDASPAVKIKSHTGKEYWILISLIVSVKGLLEL